MGSFNVNLKGRGLRGESYADVLRRTGQFGVLPTDTDEEAIGKLNADAAASAAFAEGFAGPVYADVGAGEAATTEGQIFRVSNGDGPPETTTAYRRTSGGSVVQAPLATTAALASTDPGKGVNMIATPTVSSLLNGLSVGRGPGSVWRADRFAYEEQDSAETDYDIITGGGVKLNIVPEGDGAIHLAAFGEITATSLTSAILAADRRNLWLDWGSEHIEIADQVSATLSNPLRWRSADALITYTGVSDIINPFQINLAEGVAHKIIGTGWTFDGSGKVHIGPRFTQPESTTSTTFYAERIGVRNINCIVGAGVGASGIQIRGGFDRLELVEPLAENLMIRSGAGIPGSMGVVGIQVQHNPAEADAYARLTRIIRPSVSRVYSEDSGYEYDMDGIAVFAHPDICNAHGLSRLEIIEPTMEGCWGRDVKTQVGFTSIQNPTSLINDGPSTGKLSPVFGIQTGPGEVVGGKVTIDGHACADTCSILQTNLSAGASTGLLRLVGTEIHVINGGSINTGLYHYPTINGIKAVCIVDGVLLAEGSMREMGILGTNGADKDQMLFRNTVATHLTGSLARVVASSGGSSPYRGAIRAEGNIQLGTTVPTVLMNIVGSAAQAIVSDSGGAGFSQASTYDSSENDAGGMVVLSARAPEPLFTGTLGRSGSERYFSIVLLDDETFEFPDFGYGSFSAEIRSSENNRNAYAMVSYDAGGLTPISVGSAFELGTTVDPGSGNYRLWRNSGKLTLKNAQGSARTFTILLRS